MTSQEITRKSGSNFAWAFWGLSREQRDAISALYAFCRLVDDIVDETQSPHAAKAELKRWRGMLDRLSSPSSFDSPVAWDLAKACARFPIRHEDLSWIVDGVEADLTRKRYESFEELLEYCDAVAGAVGLASMAIFGGDREKTKAFALATGRALQLTNILRDVGVDAAKGRIYLPLEDLRRFDVREKNLLVQKYDERFVQLMAFEAERARQFYQQSREALPADERHRYPAAALMRKMYEALLDRIEGVEYRVFAQKVRIPPPKKFAIAMSVWVPHFLHLS